MSKEIEMAEIAEQKQAVGTEIFDPNLPSNIDFEELPSQKPPSQSQQLASIAKVLTIGDQLKSFSVKGKLLSKPQARFQPGVPIVVPLQTHKVKMQDEQSGGLKKLWCSIVGHSKREMLVDDGFIYFFQRQKQGLLLRSSICLGSLFKVFVDPEDEQLRLVERQDEQFVNWDISPQNFILATEIINRQLVKIGLCLAE